MDLYKLHTFFMLTVNFMFVNGTAFMITSEIFFVIVEHLPNCMSNQLIKVLKKVIKLYGKGGFVMHVILMDMDFKKVKDKLDNVEVNIKSVREHVG